MVCRPFRALGGLSKSPERAAYLREGCSPSSAEDCEKKKKKKGSLNAYLYFVKTTKTHPYCLDLLGLNIGKARANCNLIMALASYRHAKSVVGLSLSPVYHYQYSSISDGLNALVADESDRAAVQEEVLRLVLDYRPSYQSGSGALVLQQDTTPCPRAHSPCLPDRGFIHVANRAVAGNKPLDIDDEATRSAIWLSAPRFS